MANSPEVQTQLSQLQSDLYKFIEESKECTNEIRRIAQEIDDHYSKITKAKIAGSALAIPGGIIAGVGFALSFVTFGASLGLSIAGGIMAGVGGATAGGAGIVDAILAKRTSKEAETKFDALQKRREQLCKECLTIGESLGDPKDVDRKYPSWVKFWVKLVFDVGSTSNGVLWNTIVSTVLNGLRIASYGDEAARLGATVGSTAFRSLGTVGRGFHIAGGVAGIVLLPFDLYTLVDSAITEHKKKPHKIANALRNHADLLDKKCPTKDQVDEMIEKTRNDAMNNM